ncbi:MAG: DUF1559 domain-containing protein [Phycisphaerales bacterium]
MNVPRPSRSRPSPARASRPCSRSAFSLIEILISLAIIALLLSLVLPGLAGARESARAAACSSNLRQLAAAVHAYAADFRGAAPPAAANALRNLDRWHGSRNAVAHAFTPSGGALSHHLGEDTALPGAATTRLCPTFAPDLTALAAAGRGFERSCGGYGYNYRFLGAVRARRADLWVEVSDRSGSALARFARPAETLAFADAAFVDPPGPLGIIEYSFLEPRWWPDLPGQRPDPSIHFRHHARAPDPGVALAARLDGHVAPDRRAFTWSSGIYGDPARDPRTGWTGNADDNRLFDYD